MAGMYAANLAEMRAKVRDWADTAVISDSVIDDFINIAIGRMARLTRVRQMEGKLRVNATAQGWMPLPTDYLEAKSLKAEIGGRDIFLERKPLDYVEDLGKSGSGTPMFFAAKGGGFWIAPTLGSVFIAELMYWKEPPTLVDDASFDWFLTANTSAVLYGALVELGVYVSDAEFSAMYEGKFTQALTEIQAIEDKANWSGDTLSVSI